MRDEVVRTGGLKVADPDLSVGLANHDVATNTYSIPQIIERKRPYQGRRPRWGTRSPVAPFSRGLEYVSSSRGQEKKVCCVSVRMHFLCAAVTSQLFPSPQVTRIILPTLQAAGTKGNPHGPPTLAPEVGHSEPARAGCPTLFKTKKSGLHRDMLRARRF
jgi:hypothetical protein